MSLYFLPVEKSKQFKGIHITCNLFNCNEFETTGSNISKNRAVTRIRHIGIKTLSG